MLYVVHDRPEVVSESLWTRACDHGFNMITLPEDAWVEITFINEKGEGGGTVDLFETNHILIEINRHQSINNMLLTLFHEIKHVEQIANGDLKENIYKGVDTKTYEYEARPHEQDAWEFEKIAMITFLETVGEMGNA